MADGGIGQKTLEIVLEHGGPCTEQQGEHPRAANDIAPFGSAGEYRPETHQQENASFHHGGRVQIGTDGGGGSHGARQPEMERELGALGQGPHQDQAQGWKIERAVLDDVTRGQHDIQIEATGNTAQNHDTGQKAKTAKSRNREGHARAILGGFRVVPVADQKEGEEAG